MVLGNDLIFYTWGGVILIRSDEINVHARVQVKKFYTDLGQYFFNSIYTWVSIYSTVNTHVNTKNLFLKVHFDLFEGKLLLEYIRYAYQF